MDWKEAVGNAEHYKAIGETEIHLGSKDEVPWELATSVEPSGSHRADIDTGLRFRASHPSGITFIWYFEIEDNTAGLASDRYVVCTEAIQNALSRVNPDLADSLRSYLRKVALVVKGHGNKLRDWAEDQWKTARALEALGEGPP